MRDPELVARAERGARRLESAWEKWRAQHGLAAAPGQPIVSYVGYSLTEPWGEPRVVIGVGADEAEYLADFLDREDGAQLQLPRQQAMMPGSPAEGGGEYPAAALVGAPVSVGTGLQSQSQSQDQVRDMGTELPRWSPGELAQQTTWSQGVRADQKTEQLSGWQGGQPATDQPPVAK
jgi:hypothetical protein